jgi:hypothetical protein
MASSTLNKINGGFYLKVTPRRAQILVQALDIALASGKLDKRIKGTVSTHRALFASACVGQSRRGKSRWMGLRASGWPTRKEADQDRPSLPRRLIARTCRAAARRSK